MKLFLMMLTAACLSTSAFAQEMNSRHTPLQPIEELPTKVEAGITVGTPAIINFAFGYWSNGDFPWVARLSGMDYGKDRGVHGEFGYQFFRREHFKQYVGIGVESLHWEDLGDDSETLYGTGVGPVYGFNLYGFSLDVGLMFGHFEENYSNSYYSYGSTDWEHTASFTLQLGYTWMF